MDNEDNEIDVDDKKHNYWCFTLNNYTEAEIDRLKNIPNVTYLVFGKEVGDSGTPHLQGYIEFKNGRYFSGLKKFNKRIRWGIRRGTSHQASMYCKKGEQAKAEWTLYSEQHGGGENGPNFGLNVDMFENGRLSQQGERTDLKILVDELMSGKITLNEIVIDNPKAYQECGRTLEKVVNIKTYGKNLTRTKLGIKTKIIWIYGPRAAEKDYLVYHYFNDIEDNIWKFPRGAGLDAKVNYSGQKYTWLSDFRGKMLYEDLLELADEWPLDFERKYMTDRINFVSEYIFITCPHTPWECYPNRTKKDSIEQLLRRCVRICHRDNQNEEWQDLEPCPNSFWKNPNPIPDKIEFVNNDKLYLNSPAYTNNL